MLNKKKIIGFEKHNPIEEIINNINHIINRTIGRYGRAWYFLGIQVFFIDCMPNKGWPESTPWRLNRFRFIPETFLKINWRKKIPASHASGHEIPAAAFMEFKEESYRFISERRWLHLYNPFKINSWYSIAANDAEVDGELHRFTHHFTRQRYLWNIKYETVGYWKEDDTEFDRDLDSYLSGDQ